MIISGNCYRKGMQKFLLPILLCCAVIAGCNKPPETGGSSTSDIGLIITGSVNADNTSGISVRIANNTSSLGFRLGGGDKLFVAIDGTQLMLNEEIIFGNLMFPEDHYYYRRNFDEDISLRNVEIKFTRPSGQDATVPVTFGLPPNIISPLPGTVFSVADDDIVVTFDADSVTPFYQVLREQPCGRTVYPSDDATTFTLPATSNNYLSCQVDGAVKITIERVWLTNPETTLNNEHTHVHTSITREVPVQYTP